MSEDIDRIGDAELAVGARVRILQGQSPETAGTVVEDFGGDAVGFA
jgi:hypothetical protein